jgi:hypothetical protein
VRFVQTHRALFDAAGLPGAMSEDRRSFDYFLGHGSAMSCDGFSLDMLDREQRTALGDLVGRYLASGLDPGWGVEPGIARLVPPASGADDGPAG